MKSFYITFGQIHTHSINGKTLDKDCVAEIQAENYNEAHQKAMEIFNGIFCFCKEDIPDMSFYPRGIIKI
jgi:hypothetical protein